MLGKIVKKLILFPLAFPLGALAQSGPQSGSPSVAASSIPPVGSGGSAIWVTFITLMLLVGAVLLVAWVLRRGVSAQSSSASIRVLATQSIGPRERLVVVTVGNRALLLGHTAGTISLLTELEPEEIAGIVESPPNKNLAQSFSAFLERSK